MKKLLPAIAVALALAAPALAAEDPKSIAQAENQKWIEAYNAGNASALASLYAEDAYLAPDGTAQPIVGAANIRTFYEGFVKSRVQNMALPVTDARMLDQNTILDVGTWTAELPGANGKAATPLSGTYISVFTRQGSEWRYSGDTWNMMPPSQSQ